MRAKHIELIVPAAKETVRVVINVEAAEQAKAISSPDNSETEF